ncbi:hypothetical protein PIB30_026936 [Stylosanthes scabra]|uniref:RNase H type-1 domain-containing protein n=1 Tax=Stylosanthes scabra TaxID=79078 RepID=A0ABU6Y925_9FABA|nr:hypothetical protein [Stylosanthes scabra]
MSPLTTPVSYDSDQIAEALPGGGRGSVIPLPKLSGSTSTGVSSVVGRDSNGVLLAVAATSRKRSSPLAAEAQAMREAVIMASNFQLDRVVFESDCQNLIQALKSKIAISEIDAVLDDIWELSNHIPNIGFI